MLLHPVVKADFAFLGNEMFNEPEVDSDVDGGLYFN